MISRIQLFILLASVLAASHSFAQEVGLSGQNPDAAGSPEAEN